MILFEKLKNKFIKKKIFFPQDLVHTLRNQQAVAVHTLQTVLQDVKDHGVHIVHLEVDHGINRAAGRIVDLTVGQALGIEIPDIVADSMLLVHRNFSTINIVFMQMSFNMDNTDKSD